MVDANRIITRISRTLPTRFLRCYTIYAHPFIRPHNFTSSMHIVFSLRSCKTCEQEIYIFYYVKWNMQQNRQIVYNLRPVSPFSKCTRVRSYAFVKWKLEKKQKNNFIWKYKREKYIEIIRERESTKWRIYTRVFKQIQLYLMLIFKL